MNISATSSGLSGIRTAMRGMQQSAFDIASQNTEESPEALKDVTQSLVDLKESEIQAKVSVKVIESENQLMKSVIDIKV